LRDAGLNEFFYVGDGTKIGDDLFFEAESNV